MGTFAGCFAFLKSIFLTWKYNNSAASMELSIDAEKQNHCGISNLIYIMDGD